MACEIGEGDVAGEEARRQKKARLKAINHRGANIGEKIINGEKEHLENGGYNGEISIINGGINAESINRSAAGGGIESGLRRNGGSNAGLISSSYRGVIIAWRRNQGVICRKWRNVAKIWRGDVGNWRSSAAISINASSHQS